MTDLRAPDVAYAWDALGGDPALLPRLSTVARLGALEARLPVRELARACVGACALAAAELGALRAGLPEVPAARVDDGAVATAFVSERHLLIDGRAPVSFAPLSRFWRTAGCAPTPTTRTTGHGFSRPWARPRTRRPSPPRSGVVVAQLSAWGAYGPWGGRRGFDSVADELRLPG